MQYDTQEGNYGNPGFLRGKNAFYYFGVDFHLAELVKYNMLERHYQTCLQYTKTRLAENKQREKTTTQII